MGFKTRLKDRNKTVGHGKGQPRRGDGKSATIDDLVRVSRGQGETNKGMAKHAKASRRRRR